MIMLGILLVWMLLLLGLAMKGDKLSYNGIGLNAEYLINMLKGSIENFAFKIFLLNV